MATFLQLCADLARESGAIGAPPSTVVGTLPTRQAQCVSWIRGAWVLIQNLRKWNFLRQTFEAPLVIGQTSYVPAELGIATRFDSWVEQTDHKPGLSLYDFGIGRKDEQWLNQIDLDYWLRSYDFGAQVTNRPTQWAIGYDGSLKIGQAPDKAYRVRGEYRKAPQVLVADTDVPEMPARFHNAIVFRAIMLMAESDEAVQSLQTAQLEFANLLSQMMRDLLPAFTTTSDGPLDRR